MHAEVRVPRGVLDAIGRTRVVELRRLVPAGSARILAKLESANPTGSMKDRMAKAVIEAAEADGRLPPGGTVVEYTAGTTGVSLALVCAATGHQAEFVFSDAFSDEKRATMQAFGGRVTDVKSDHRQISRALIKEMIRTAGEISRRPGHWWCDQLNNRDAMAGYSSLGEEIWSDTNGGTDAFAPGVATPHSIPGVTQALWTHNPKIEVTAVEPAESAVLSGRPTGSHKIEGIGIGFIPPLWNPQLVNRIETVKTEEAKGMARRLAREEGIFAGTSTGANVVAALRAVLPPAAAPAAPPAPNAPAPPPPPITPSNQTLRQIVHTSIAGARARVVLANTFGTTAMNIGGASIAVRDRDAAIVPASVRKLTVNGSPAFRIPAGATGLTHPGHLQVPAPAGRALR